MITLYSKQGDKLRQWQCFAQGAEVVVIHGQVGGKQTEKRYTAEPKNHGKANATTAEEQAALEVQAKITLQLKRGYYPTQEEAMIHVDFTPMLAQNSNKYQHKVEYPCYISAKFNGCFSYATRILTLEGYKKIGDIVTNKLDVSVASYNEDTETVEFKKVTNWFHNGLKHRNSWLTFNRSARITKAHKVWSEGRWVEAQDVVSTLFGVNPRYNGIIAGMLLGDSVASVEKRTKLQGKRHSWRLTFRVAEHDTMFGEKKSNLLSGVEWRSVDLVSGYGKPVKQFTSKSLSESPFDISMFYTTDRESEDYGRRREHVDIAKLKEVFTDESLLVWYMDDGSINYNNGSVDTPRMFLSVARYSDETIEGFVKLFKDVYRVTPSFGKYGKDKRLCFSTPDTCYLLMRLAKIGAGMCDRKFPQNLKLGFLESQPAFCEVKSNIGDEYARGGEDTFYEAFDIEVEDNHNYFAEGVLVHNCRSMVDKNVQAWSKQGEVMTLPSHWTGLDKIIELFPSLDGEVFAGTLQEGGLPLQSIVSALRKPNSDTHKLKYYVYDIPCDKPMSERVDMLTALDIYVKNNNISFIEVVVPSVVNSWEEVTDYTNTQIALGQEGSMIRNFRGVYEYGKRSYDLLKVKIRLDAEAEVLSYTLDKNDEPVYTVRAVNGEQTDAVFKLKMKIPDGKIITGLNYRSKENAESLLGQHITYEYEELSSSEIPTPTKPVGLCVREVVGGEGRF